MPALSIPSALQPTCRCMDVARWAIEGPALTATVSSQKNERQRANQHLPTTCNSCQHAQGTGRRLPVRAALDLTENRLAWLPAARPGPPDRHAALQPIPKRPLITSTALKAAPLAAAAAAAAAACSCLRAEPARLASSMWSVLQPAAEDPDERADRLTAQYERDIEALASAQLPPYWDGKWGALHPTLPSMPR